MYYQPTSLSYLSFINTVFHCELTTRNSVHLHPITTESTHYHIRTNPLSSTYQRKRQISYNTFYNASKKNYPTGMKTEAILIQINSYVCLIHTYFNVILNMANLHNIGVNSTTYHYFKTEHVIPTSQYILEVEILCLQA
jgi:hypothetical protein